MSTIFSGASRYTTDFQSVIQRAVAIQSLHLTQISSEKARLSGQSTALATLQSKFNSLTSTLAALETAAGLDSFSSSTSTQGVVQLSLSEGVAEGTFKVRVTGLGAQTVTMSKDGLTTVSDPGSANISAGTEFTLTVDGTPVAITPAAQTLNSLAEAINDAAAGVRATVVNVGPPSSPDYRLSLTSEAYENVAVTLSDGGTPLLDTLAAGANATYTVNGVTVYSDSRTVTLSPGVSMTLQDESAAGVDTTITISRTLASAKNALSAFATSYNAAVAAIDAHRGQAGGALAGDMLIRMLGDALRGAANYETASGDIPNLTALGLTFNEDGELQFNASTFDAAVQGKTDDLIGFLDGFRLSAQAALAAVADPTSGAIDTAADLVTSMMAGQEKLEAAEQERVDLFEETLMTRMSQADALIANLEQQVNYYTGLFESMRTAQKMYSA